MLSDPDTARSPPARGPRRTVGAGAASSRPRLNQANSIPSNPTGLVQLADQAASAGSAACSAGTCSSRWNSPTQIAAIPAETVATRNAAFAPAASTTLPAAEAPSATPRPSAVPIQVNASVTAARGTSSSANVNELIRDGDTATPATTTNGIITQISPMSSRGTLST